MNRIAIDHKARQVRQLIWMRCIGLSVGVRQSVAATRLMAREFDAPVGVKPIE